MNRRRFALLALTGITLSVSRAAPAQAQVCPWGMHAQLQMQIQWQHQQTMQQHIAAYMQMQTAHQQALQQHMIHQTLAAQHLQALYVQRVTLQTHAAALHIQNTHLQRNAAALHVQNTHLQRNTAALHMQNTHLQRNTAALHVQNTHLQRNTAALTANRATVQSHHSPSVQIRASMVVTCGQCHQNQPSAPTLALKPPGTPFKTFLNNPRRPAMPQMIAGAVRPMPKAIGQLPRQPLLPFLAPRPVIQPIVHLPRTAPLGLIPVRMPMQPVVAPLVVAATPPLAPIALLPPPLPMIHKPSNRVSLPAVTKSPGDSMPRESTTTGGSASSGASVGSATSSSLEDTVSELVSLIAQGKPSERRKADDPESPPILPEMMRQAPPRPVLVAKYPVPPLLAVGEHPLPSRTTKPSLVEVVLQPPQLPALPEPAAQKIPVP